MLNIPTRSSQHNKAGDEIYCIPWAFTAGLDPGKPPTGMSGKPENKFHWSTVIIFNITQHSYVIWCDILFSYSI